LAIGFGFDSDFDFGFDSDSDSDSAIGFDSDFGFADPNRYSHSVGCGTQPPTVHHWIDGWSLSFLAPVD
jgi:hypothetical protein